MKYREVNYIERIIIFYQVFSLFFLGNFFRINGKFIWILLAINFISILYLLSKKKLIFFDITFLIISITLATVHILFFKYSTFNELPFVLLVGSLLILFRLLFKEGEENRSFFSKCLLFFGIVSCTVGIIEGITRGTNIFSFLPIDSSRFLTNLRTQSTENYQIIGSYAHPLIFSFVIISIISYVFTIKNPVLRYTIGLLFVLTSFFTQKRTGMVLSIVTLFSMSILDTYMVNKNRFKISSIIKTLFSLLVVMVFVFFFKIGDQSLWDTLSQKLLELNEENYSILHRVTSLKMGFETFLHGNIFGVFIGNGLRSLSSYYSTNSINITVNNFFVIDNSYLSFLNDFGIITVIFLVTYIIFKVLTIIKYTKVVNVNEKRTMYISLNSLLFILVDIAFFDALNWYQPIFLIIVNFGIVDSILQEIKRSYHEVT